MRGEYDMNAPENHETVPGLYTTGRPVGKCVVQKTFSLGVVEWAVTAGVQGTVFRSVVVRVMVRWCDAPGGRQRCREDVM